MKLRKIDVLLAEHKPLSVEEGNVKKLGRYYYEVECPFCGKKNLVFFRNFWFIPRCSNCPVRKSIGIIATHLSSPLVWVGQSSANPQ